MTNPLFDVPGRCTDQLITGTRRCPESPFNAEAVLTARARHGVAVEIAPVRNGSTRPNGCCAVPSRRGASCPSTPTRTLPGNSMAGLRM